MNTPDALAKQIEQEYFQNFQRLSQASQYHLLNHLYLWNGHEGSARLLPSFKSRFYGDHRLIKNRMTQLYESASNLPIKNAASLRLPYLTKYPTIRASALVMLDALYAESLFGLDVRPVLSEVLPADIESVFQKLQNDSDALFYLSTYGVNFLYLFDRYYGRKNSIETGFMLEVLSSRQLATDQELVLHCYYLTHSIINETLFYSQPISESSAAKFRIHLGTIDKHLRDTTARDMLNLDCKLELLVCAKICTTELTSESAILSEALRSVSKDGVFLVDKHNKAGQVTHSDLSTSEHRNALFLMSQFPLDPRPKPVL